MSLFPMFDECLLVIKAMPEPRSEQEYIALLKVHDVLPCVKLSVTLLYPNQLIKVMKVERGGEICLDIFFHQKA